MGKSKNRIFNINILQDIKKLIQDGLHIAKSKLPDGAATSALQEEIKDALIYSIEASIDTGEASGGSNTTLEDTGKNWATNVYRNAHVQIERGDINYITTITSHSTDTLTFPDLGVAVQAGDRYWIKIPIEIQDIERWGGTPLTGRDISLDLEALHDNIVKDTVKTANLILSGTTQEQLSDLSVVNLVIQANPDNVEYIYVGLDGVSTAAHLAVLAPGGSISLNLNNANLLYVRGAASDKVSYGGVINV